MKTNEDGTIVFDSKQEFDAEVRKANEGIMNDLATERKQRTAMETSLKELQGKMAKIETDKAAADAENERLRLEGAGKYEDALKLKDEAHKKQVETLNAELEKERSLRRSELIDNAILSIASDAIDPQDIKTLVKARYNFEVTDKGVEVKNVDGTPLLMDNGGPATVEFAYKKFVADKPHLLKADAEGGSGGQPNRHEPAKQGTLQEQYRAAVAAGDTKLATMIKGQIMGAGSSLNQPIRKDLEGPPGPGMVPGQPDPAKPLTQPRNPIAASDVGRPVVK